MFAVSKRELVEVTNCNPPPGFYYQPIDYNGRGTDFNLRQPTQKRISMPQYQNRSPPTFPLLLPQKQLHGYARPKDRVEFNRRHPVIRNTFQYEALPVINMKQTVDESISLTPNFSFVKPRAIGGVMNPPTQNQQKFIEPNNFDPLQDEIIQGLAIAKEQNEISNNKNKPVIESIVEQKFLNQSSNYVESSTLQHSEYQEQKELRKELIQNQHLSKRKQNHHNIINDSLEALLNRDKFRGPEELPGPGQYIDINKLSSFKQKSAQKKMDSLNTRSKRNSKTQDQIPPPSYRYYDSYISDFDKNKNGFQFGKMVGREKPKKSDSIPPVGKYNISNQFAQKEDELTISIQFPSAFGSGSKRFS